MAENPARLAGVIACLALASSCVTSGPAAFDPSEYARDLTRATNGAREEFGLEQLTPSSCLAAEARERAQVLVERDLEHLPLQPVSEACGGSKTAENLVETSRGPTAVLSEWMESSGHRNNIIDPSLTEIGTGCARTRARILCAQLFLATRE